MATFWRTRDRLGREVGLTEARWAHIMKNHETGLSGREADVRAMVERPELVTRDAGDPSVSAIIGIAALAGSS